MKHIIAYEFLNRLKRNPKLLRKVKVFTAIGVVVIFVTGALAIWAGVTAIDYLASSANQAIQSPVTQGHIENLKSDLEGLPNFQPVNCWEKVQALLGVQPWLERSALENFTNLKMACFEQKSNLCRGNDCEQLKETFNTAEGNLI
ncbi:MAG: hypothetical protein A4S09_02300 [Proteobacteria bacterium SG_bin7]|nr:MAG: hypothetical protein A4S09_02300 [Proteobacteria bacterium SG_bin7]